MLVSSQTGIGKATLICAVCVRRRLIELDGPEVSTLIAEHRLKP